MKKSEIIVILATDGDATRALFHKLEERFGVAKIILEEKVSKKRLVSRRVKSIGLTTTIGQLFFILLVQPLLKKASGKRINEILHINSMNTESIPTEKVIRVGSVNEEATQALLKELEPDVIIINGTRIISKRTLESVSGKWVNIHAGITPKYRGVHGAYWALVNQDKDLCGVTVHFVDKGIDTGDVIAQTILSPSPEDNFVTYPYLQYAAGLQLLVGKLEEYFLTGKIETSASLTNVSKLWYHPTFWRYLKQRLRAGIK